MVVVKLPPPRPLAEHVIKKDASKALLSCASLIVSTKGGELMPGEDERQLKIEGVTFKPSPCELLLAGSH